jgi:hypothetical protein
MGGLKRRRFFFKGVNTRVHDEREETKTIDTSQGEIYKYVNSIRR